MSDMKCPFCQQELDTGNYYVHCHNPHCDITEEMEGTEEMWEALIRTRKALNVAVDTLKSAQRYICSDKKSYQIIQTAIEQITALEQKDVK